MNETGISDRMRYVPRSQPSGKWVIVDLDSNEAITDDNGYTITFRKSTAIEVCRRMNAE